jgi:hypothetical protein
MGLLDPFTGALRSVLGVAETAATHTPLDDARMAEHGISELVHALHRVADSTERHVELLEGLAETIGPLNDKVTVLNTQVDELMAVLAPLQAAEKDISRVEHLFGRHRRHDAPPDEPPAG